MSRPELTFLKSFDEIAFLGGSDGMIYPAAPSFAGKVSLAIKRDAIPVHAQTVTTSSGKVLRLDVYRCRAREFFEPGEKHESVEFRCAFDPVEKLWFVGA